MKLNYKTNGMSKQKSWDENVRTSSEACQVWRFSSYFLGRKLNVNMVPI